MDEQTTEMVKEILIQYNMPINKQLISTLRDYIRHFGGDVATFKRAIETDADERDRLSSFVAKSNASLIATGALPQHHHHSSSKSKTYISPAFESSDVLYLY